MDADRALFLIDQLLWNAVVIGGPIIVATMIVGLAISVLQVATQLQEITLSYVPKLMTAAALMFLLGGWMLSRLNQFALSLYAMIPSLGG